MAEELDAPAADGMPAGRDDDTLAELLEAVVGFCVLYNEVEV